MARDVMRWLYIPFANIQDDPTMPGNKKRYTDKYQARIGVIHHPEKLNDVDNDDVLIIGGHGMPGSKEIGVSVLDNNVSWHEMAARKLYNKPPATTYDTLTAHSLAERIFGSDLDLGHKHIKLLTCGGAGMAIVDAAGLNYADANNRHPAAWNFGGMAKSVQDCLVAVFAEEMGKKGYDKIMVRGYPGFVNAMGQDKTLTVESPDKRGSVQEHEVYNGWGGFKNEQYWKESVTLPTKLINEKFWFNNKGQRVIDYRAA